MINAYLWRRSIADICESIQFRKHFQARPSGVYVVYCNLLSQAEAWLHSIPTSFPGLCECQPIHAREVSSVFRFCGWHFIQIQNFWEWTNQQCKSSFFFFFFFFFWGGGGGGGGRGGYGGREEFGKGGLGDSKPWPCSRHKELNFATLFERKSCKCFYLVQQSVQCCLRFTHLWRRTKWQRKLTSGSAEHAIYSAPIQSTVRNPKGRWDVTLIWQSLPLL